MNLIRTHSVSSNCFMWGNEKKKCVVGMRATEFKVWLCVESR